MTLSITTIQFDVLTFEESIIHFTQEAAAAAPIGPALFQHLHKEMMLTKSQ